jgi:hypothetical protein
MSSQRVLPYPPPIWDQKLDYNSGVIELVRTKCCIINKINVAARNNLIYKYDLSAKPIPLLHAEISFGLKVALFSVKPKEPSVCRTVLSLHKVHKMNPAWGTVSVLLLPSSQKLLNEFR